MRIAILMTICVVVASVAAAAQSAGKRAESDVSRQMEQYAAAILRSDVEAVAAIYSEDLILTSQSGRVYGKSDALADVKNSFERYVSSDLRFLTLGRKLVIVSYQNLRKRKGLDEAAFRVTAVWKKEGKIWRIVSMQSSRIAAQGM